MKIEGPSTFYAGLARGVGATPIPAAEVQKIQKVLEAIGPEGTKRITQEMLARLGIPAELRPHVILQALQKRIPNLNLANVANDAHQALNKLCDLSKLEKDSGWASQHLLEELLSFHHDVTLGPPMPKDDSTSVAVPVLERITTPAVAQLQTFRDSAGTKMEIGVENYEGRVHHYGAIQIIDKRDGTFGVQSWQLEGRDMSTFDHQTLLSLERLATRTLAVLQAPGSPDTDGTAAMFMDGFRRSVAAHRAELEARYDRLGVQVENALAPLRGKMVQVDKGELDKLIESLPQASVARDEGLFPRAEAHLRISDSLRQITNPELGGYRKFLETKGKSLEIGSLYEGEVHHYGAMELTERPDGSFGVSASQSGNHDIKDFDHATLLELERISLSVLQKTTPAQDPTISVGSPRTGAHQMVQRFLSKVQASIQQMENGEELKSMRPFLAVEPSLTIPELREMIRRGVSADDFALVKGKVSRGWHAEPFATAVQQAVFDAKAGKVHLLGKTEVLALAAAMLKSKNAYEESGAQVALALMAETPEEKARVLEGAAKYAAADRVPIIVPSKVAIALVGSPEDAKQVFADGVEWAARDTKYVIIGGLGLLAASATTPAQRKVAWNAAKEWPNSDYIDMSGQSLPRAAIVADGQHRRGLYEKAKTAAASKYTDIAAGGMVAMALCAESPAQKREAFDLGKKELASQRRTMIEGGLLAMALGAQTEAERQEAMRAAKEIADDSRNVPAVRIPALIAMSIAACKDAGLARRAVAATLDG